MAKKSVRSAYFYFGLVAVVLVVAAVAPGKGFLRSKFGRVAAATSAGATSGLTKSPQSAALTAASAPVALALTSPATPANARVVRVVNGSVPQGQNIVVSITLDSQGDENAFGFSVTYETSKLTYVSAVNGSDAASASLLVNAQSGKIGIGQSLSPGTAFTAGTREILRVTFTANVAGNTAVGFGDQPVPREVVSAAVTDLTATTDFTGGTVTVNNPIPTLANISPTSAQAGSSAFPLTVNGTNFNSTSVVRWNGSPRATTLVNSTQLTAAITVTDVATAGTPAVTVFNPAPGGGESGSATFTITNPAPIISLLTPPSAAAGSGGFPLTIDGTSLATGATVKFGANSYPGTVNGPGTQVTASIPGSDIATPGSVTVKVANVGSADSNGLTFTIGKANQTITVGTHAPASAAYNSSFTVAATSTSGLAVVYSSSGSCTNVGPLFTMTSGSGTCTVKYNQAGDAIYNPATQVTEDVTASKINQAVLTLTGVPPTAAHNSSFPVTPGGGSSSAPLVVSTSGVCSAAGNNITMTSGTGTCTVKVNRAGDSNYNAATEVSQAATASKINQAVLTLTGVPASAAFNSTFTVTPGGGSSSAPLVVSTSGVCSAVGNDILMTSGTGICTVKVNRAGDSNYNAATEVSQSVTASLLNQAPLTLSGVPASAPYNSSFTVTPGGGSSSAPLVVSTSGVCTAAGNNITMTSGTGTCTVKVNRAGDSTYGAATEVSQSATASKINQAVLTLTGVPASAAFNSSFPVTPGGGSSSAALVVSTSGVCTAAGNNITMTSGTGTCTVKVNRAGDSNYNAATEVSQNATASKSSQSIIFAPLGDRTFGDADFSVSASASSGLAVSFAASGNCTITGSTVHLTSAGSCTITASQAGDSNYNAATDVPRSFSVINPTPTISNLSPSSGTVGTGFLLTITGTDFVSGATIHFGGNDHPATLNDATHVSANIPGSELPSAGSIAVTVSNPGSSNSGSLTFSVSNPTPTISSLSPSSITAGTGFLLTITGTDFVSGATIHFGGNDHAANLDDATHVSATIAGSELPTDGPITVTVTNPAPGGGTSNGLTFTVTPPPNPGEVLINEFRFHGSAGPADEFVELYNNTDAPYDISGYTLYALNSGGAQTLVFSIPGALGSNTTVMPARSHYLIANNAPVGGFSMTTESAPDGNYAGDIPDGSGVALFGSATPSPDTRIDSVGFDSSNPLFIEGGSLTPVGGITVNGDHGFVRKILLTTGRPQDTDNNADDFNFVSPSAEVINGTISKLGAPGPENSSSPIQRNSTIKASLVDTAAGSFSAPNRVRDTTPNACGEPNCLMGTLDIRRQFKNNTGQPVTRLRFRVVDITSAPAPSGTADLRVLTSSDLTVNLVGGGTALIRGLTLEQPSLQANGGGLNSTLAAGVVTLNAPVGPGASINIRFLLGVQQLGSFRFFINVEALP